jgi:hypothetical protein
MELQEIWGADMNFITLKVAYNSMWAFVEFSALKHINFLCQI